MTSTEMQEAVAQLPDEYLRNYVESYEAGIVGPFANPMRCVVSCMGNAPGERERQKGLYAARLRLGARSRFDIETPIEFAYGDAAGEDVPELDGPHQAAFRTALYDACIREQAARAAKSHRLPTECPETQEAQK